MQRATDGTVTPAALAATHAAAFLHERPWRESEFASLLAGRGTILTGDAAAFVVGRVVLDEVEILTVATHPDHRRAGLARRRVAALLDKARNMGATTAFLEVAADNGAARALYRDLGFDETGRRRSYYARETGKVDAITMSLRLT
ncbi:MAG: GNAT family N-acetyltransferase [Paracoccaceae bacterium]